jgi:hypothetical protein
VLGKFLGDVGVLGRHHPVEELHDRDVDPEVAHHVGELDTDRPEPAMMIAAGQVRVEDLLLVGDDVVARLRRRAASGYGRTGRDDEVVEGDDDGSTRRSRTSIEVAPVRVPQPSISVILFFFMRKWTPLTMPADTWRERLWVGP